MKKLNFRSWIIIVAVGLLGFGAYRVLGTSTITVVLNDGLSPLSTRVTVDNKDVAPVGKGGNRYPVKVSPGKHEVVVTSAGKEDYKTNVTTGILSNKVVEASLGDLPAEKAAAKIYTDDNTQTSGATYYGDKEWLVFFASGGEGSIVVARHNKLTDVWDIVDEGTDIDTSQSIYADAPPDLVSRLEQL